MVNALNSGGFSLGAQGGNHAVNMATRIGAGGAVGATQAGMINPADYKTGALLGAILPPGVRVAGKTGELVRSGLESGSRNLMNSALKPVIAAHKSGDAKVAVDTLLKLGLSPNEASALKLHGLLDTNADEVSRIIANSSKSINKQDVLSYLDDTRSTFRNQVDPMADLDAIDRVGANFSSHPYFANGSDTMPIQQAQAVKSGTQKVLKKKYGQQGAADVEASKALARGLREEIGKAEPAVIPLNEYDQKLIKTLSVMERRMLIDANNNPLGLTALASNPASAAAFMADRSMAFRSLLARSMFRAQALAGKLPATSSPLLGTIPIAISASP